MWAAIVALYAGLLAGYVLGRRMERASAACPELPPPAPPEPRRSTRPDTPRTLRPEERALLEHGTRARVLNPAAECRVLEL